MKNQAYKFSELKFKIRSAQADGKKQLVWKLSEEQAEFLRNLGYRVEDYLYWIETKTWIDVRHKPGVLKELHYLRKKGVKKKIRTLSKKDRKLLEDHSVRFGVLKYRIILN